MLTVYLLPSLPRRPNNTTPGVQNSNKAKKAEEAARMELEKKESEKREAEQKAKKEEEARIEEAMRGEEAALAEVKDGGGAIRARHIE